MTYNTCCSAAGCSCSAQKNNIPSQRHNIPDGENTMGTFLWPNG